MTKKNLELHILEHDGNFTIYTYDRNDEHPLLYRTIEFSEYDSARHVLKQLFDNERLTEALFGNLDFYWGNPLNDYITNVNRRYEEEKRMDAYVRVLDGDYTDSSKPIDIGDWRLPTISPSKPEPWIHDEVARDIDALASKPKIETVLEVKSEAAYREPVSVVAKEINLEVPYHVGPIDGGVSSTEPTPFTEDLLVTEPPTLVRETYHTGYNF